MHWEQLLRLKNGEIERLEGSLAQTALCSVDGSQGGSEDQPLDLQRTRQAIAQLQQKILRLTEQLRIEQAASDENVAEYLKLANNTNDKQQSCRLKQIFEKKNQKSAATITQLQRKLEHYRRRLREAEQGSDVSRQHKGVLRDVQQGLRGVGARVITGLNDGVVNSVRGGLSSFSHATHTAAGAVASKPREIALLLRNRFGSADNISLLKDGEDHNGANASGHLQGSPRFGSDDDCSSATSGSAGANSMTGGNGGPPSSKGNTLERGNSMGMEMLIQEVQELREVHARLDEALEELKVHYQRDYTLSLQTLQEERFRSLWKKREKQLPELKIIVMISEALEACQTRISNMELQQQQVVQLEGLESVTVRALVGKFINIFLAFMAVILVFLSTVANCVGPLVKTCCRFFLTMLFLLLFSLLWNNWDTFLGHAIQFLHTMR
ncbi:Transmembrane and coiled-coil domains protein 1 [Bagarius yarrelli]|uniref:Transmembrane and coiled-coil domains protein 1 n=1 Tax=Bagarius yarrelli TaxID=175774 RepID=A0A556U200_BAGYA|nr:Transmembrane and coiled-coil domains protein 1 [Bagarius yarrelli]